MRTSRDAQEAASPQSLLAPARMVGYPFVFAWRQVPNASPRLEPPRAFCSGDPATTSPCRLYAQAESAFPLQGVRKRASRTPRLEPRMIRRHSSPTLKLHGTPNVLPVLLYRESSRWSINCGNAESPFCRSAGRAAFTRSCASQSYMLSYTGSSTARVRIRMRGGWFGDASLSIRPTMDTSSPPCEETEAITAMQNEHTATTSWSGVLTGVQVTFMWRSPSGLRPSGATIGCALLRKPTFKTKVSELFSLANAVGMG